MYSTTVGCPLIINEDHISESADPTYSEFLGSSFLSTDLRFLVRGVLKCLLLNIRPAISLLKEDILLSILLNALRPVGLVPMNKALKSYVKKN